MLSVLFVCHGNICRSPMAEYILLELARRRGMADRVRAASAGVSAEELGHPVYPPARAELARHGIPCPPRRAVLLRKEDYDRWDLILGMDESNLRGMRRVFGGDPAGKLDLLLRRAGTGGDVADPWYFGGFDTVYRQIETACEALLDGQ